jgi:hypothetical protein
MGVQATRPASWGSPAPPVASETAPPPLPHAVTDVSTAHKMIRARGVARGCGSTSGNLARSTRPALDGGLDGPAGAGLRTMQLVSHTTHGLEVKAQRPQLGAQVQHMGVHGPHASHVPVAPHPGQ